MKIKFLGTGASEGFPALFCNCEYCIKARELGGKNIRTRHQTLINDDLLIDFPADSYYHALVNNIRLDKIKYLIVTHSHEDHFYPKELRNRVEPYAHNLSSLNLDIYCGVGAKNAYLNDNGGEKYQRLNNSVKIHTLQNYIPTNIGNGYIVTAMPAKHHAGDDAKIYIIEQGGKKLLYAHDTGLIYDQVFDYIEKSNITFDFITLDCTNVNLAFSDECSHMGFSQIEKVVAKLKSINAILDKTIKYVNHFSHNGNAIQSNVESYAKQIDFNVAFDGEEVNF